jgi:excisionase family DNA binding protein
MIDENKVYTVDDIQKILGINKNRAYSLSTSGQFPFIRIGKRIIVPRKTFDDWMYSDTEKVIE